jgi:hypothetical protein
MKIGDAKDKAEMRKDIQKREGEQWTWKHVESLREKRDE